MSDFSDPDFEDGWTSHPPTDSTTAALSREIETLRAVCESNKRAYVGAVKAAWAAEAARDTWAAEAADQTLRAERAEATLTAVRALHERDPEADYCVVCSNHGDITWPCATIAVLDQHGQTTA